MKIFKHLVTSAIFAVCLTSCAGGPSTTTGENTVEAICVISGEDATGGPTADFMGQTVNFCCKRCKARWDKMDDSARKQAVADLNK